MLWDVTCLVIREVIATTGVKPEDIAGVAVTSHGDGIYLVDEWGRPTRPGILSLDTRAAELVAGWERTGQSDTVLPLSGQKPWPGSPVSVLAWLARNEPDVMARTAYALPGKDAIKQRLTNVFSTDPTESSLSFTNVYSQEYDVETLRVFEVDELFRLLPEVIPSGRIAGEVTVAAAERCGLAPGTPVASGSHDVDCGAIGMGTVLPGQLAIIAGTFSINEVISDAARVDGRWNARNFVVPGQWMNMSLSPSSATNLEWFATRLAAHDVRAGGAVGDPFAFVEEDLRAIEASPSDLVYLPFLYGSPYTIDASAAFLGLRGWHERGHMVGAVMEGVVFNHRHHVDALRDGFDVTDIRLTGGAVNSGRWVQMFADTLATPVKVSNVREAGALGSAMLAGIAVGVYSDLPDAAAAIVAEPVVREPTPAGVARQEDNYRRYQRVIEAMTTVWTGSRGDPMTWIGTSWKMNKTLAEARAFVDGMVAARSVLRGVQTFVIPPHTAIAAVRERLPCDVPVIVGAQNAHWEPGGAYTGEVSMGMVADAGATLVEIGHWERRAYFGETDDTVALKVEAAVAAGLTPLLCVGEPARVRSAGGEIDWIAAQVSRGLARLAAQDLHKVVIAYEPVWAIGDLGREALPHEIAPVMAMLSARLGPDGDTRSRVAAVLYGGSVNRLNAAALLDVPGTDGLFIGRAAWQVADFLALVSIGARAGSGRRRDDGAAR
ncbi:MAG: Sugar (pentulose and hexulose) kinase [Sphaerisporangium sp.]|nr:Sugar (pentulose and hexulose) kinase [Sphaerisporangium sp.]